MSTVRPDTSKAYNRKNTGTVLHGGNVDSADGPLNNNMTLLNNTTNHNPYDGKSPVNNSRVGTAPAPITGGTYNKLDDFIGPYLADSIAGTADTTFNGPAADFSHRKAVTEMLNYETLGITGFDIYTGAATTDSNLVGSGVTFADDAAIATTTIPHKFTYMHGKLTATTTNFGKVTNP